MNGISVKFDKALNFLSDNVLENNFSIASNALSDLLNGKGKGNDFLGWVNLPNDIDNNLLDSIEESARVLSNNCDIIVVIGVGGSYLGAKAVIEALNNSFDLLQKDRKNPIVLFAGQNIGEDYLFELQELLKDKKFGIISISKSGTTTEPAIAFRLLKTPLENHAGTEVEKKLIICITDKEKGALRILADKEGFTTYVIPANVGGRFSLLTPVGLLLTPVAGYDIRTLVNGAIDMKNKAIVPSTDNIAIQYAIIRNELYKTGKKIELLVNFNPKLHYIAEWWKQLYGESEGKDGKGIFPAAVDFTTDLHSMGQYIQDGERHLFETVITVEKSTHSLLIPHDKDNLDGLNFLAGKNIDNVNKMAELGTCIAHVDGGVPNLQIVLPELSEYYLGQLLYFFEIACGISGYILGVNPLNQPGVEAYKKNMFALLDKPGYEEESKLIKNKL